MRRYHTQILLFIVVCSLLASGCIKEDRDNCDTLQLSFRYFGDGDRDILREKISSIELHLFDHEGNYVKEWTDLSNAVSDQRVLLQVNPGDYQIIAVGNNKSETMMHNSGMNYIDHFQLTNPKLINNEPYVQTFDDLYMGIKSISVKEGGEITEDVIDFESSHIDVVIEVRGYYQYATNNKLPTMLSFTNVTSGISLYNVPTGNYCHVVRLMEYKDEENPVYIYKFNILHYGSKHGFPINSNIEFQSSRAEADFSFNVWKYIQENPSINLEKKEAVLPILIEFTPVGVEVKLPEWYIQDVKPEFGD